MGNSIQNVVPLPDSVSNPMDPCIFSTICLEICNPSPVPPLLRVAEESACENFPKMRDRNSSGIPAPESFTEIRIFLPKRLVEIETIPPEGENLAALDSRL